MWGLQPNGSSVRNVRWPSVLVSCKLVDTMPWRQQTAYAGGRKLQPCAFLCVQDNQLGGQGAGKATPRQTPVYSPHPKLAALKTRRTTTVPVKRARPV
jgi:hypothetical protein